MPSTCIGWRGEWSGSTAVVLVEMKTLHEQDEVACGYVPMGRDRLILRLRLLLRLLLPVHLPRLERLIPLSL
jgi:hypothetical protein